MLLVGEAFARPLIDELESGAHDASSVAFVAVGGAITSPETKQRLLDLLPHAIIADIAGSSETEAPSHRSASQGQPARRESSHPGPVPRSSTPSW